MARASNAGSPKAESYTGPTVWRLMQQELVEAGIEQIAPASAKAMCEEDGWTLLDVRPSSDYNRRHCWGAVNAQYYRALDSSDPRNWANSALSAMIFPERLMDGKGYLNVTENEGFLDEVMESVEWGQKLILYDDVGGVIGEPGVNFENGVQTPSLMALYELAARGWGTENLLHMAGGLLYWDEVERFDCGEVRGLIFDILITILTLSFAGPGGRRRVSAVDSANQVYISLHV